MKFAWMSALALTGAIAVAPSFISAAGGASADKTPAPAPEKSDKETPKAGDTEAKTFNSASEVIEYLGAEAKKLGRPSKAQLQEFVTMALTTVKDHITSHADATDLNELYDWVQARAQIFQADDVFMEIANLYLKDHSDFAEPGTYQWKKIVLLAEIRDSDTKKTAETELKKLEADGAKDAAKAVFAADIRVSLAQEAKDTKAAASVVDALKKNKLVAASKDAWVYRDYQRMVLAQSTATLKDGEKFPCWSEALPVRDLDNKEIKIADYKGKVVLIDFWATWCGPCMGEMPNVIKLYDELHKDGFEVIGISFDNRGGEEILRNTIAGKAKVETMPWRQIFDGGGWGSGMAGRYGVRSIPKTVLIDKDGKVVAQGLRGTDLDKKVRELLGK